MTHDRLLTWRVAIHRVLLLAAAWILLLPPLAVALAAPVPQTIGDPADLAVTKSASAASVNPGGTLTYTIVVTNNGPDPSTNTVLTDTLPAQTVVTFTNTTQGTCAPTVGNGVTCSLGTLNNGATATVMIGVSVSPGASGTLVNTATATGDVTDPNPGNNTSTTTTPVNATADLFVTKTDAPDPVNPQSFLFYTVTVGNNGPATATAVTMTDMLPAGVTFVGTNPSGSCVQAGGQVTCSFGSLTSGATATVTIQVLVPIGLAGSTLTNTASASAVETDPNSANNSATATTTVNPATDLSITKTDNPDPVNPGQTLQYSILITNNGPSTATGVTLNDTLPGSTEFVSATPSQGTCSFSPGIGFDCSLGTLATGDSATVVVDVTVDTDAGGVTFCNNAYLSANEVDPNLGNNQAVQCTTANVAPDLSVTKTDSPDPVQVGQHLIYTVTVTNNSSFRSPATGVVLTDMLPAGVTFVSATPSQGSCSQSGGTVTCQLGVLEGTPNTPTTATVTIDVVPTAANAGTIMTNTASVTANEFDPNTGNNSASTTTMVGAASDLAVTKTDAPDPVNVGQNLLYTVTVTNNGPDAATGVTLTDTLPSGVMFVSATPSQGSCTQSGGTVTCALSSIGSGSNANVIIDVRPTVANAGTTITNSATASGNQFDPNTANNTATATTQVNQVADLSVAKTDSPDPVNPTTNLTYTVTVTNSGPAAATGVTLTDTLPAGVTFVSATPTQGSCSQAGGTVTCSLGTLANGANAMASIVVTPPLSMAGTIITNTAQVSASQVDPNTGNNTATTTTQVNPAANLAVSKADSPDPVNVGQNLVYTVTVTNSGPSTAAGTTLTDTLPTGVTFVSASVSPGGSCSQSGGTVTCNLGTVNTGGVTMVTITVTPQAGTAGTTITNTAQVTSVTFDPSGANNTATTTTSVSAGPTADLAVTKVDAPDPIRAGRRLTYNIAVTNNGPAQATGVTVTDTLPAGVTFESASPRRSCSQSGNTVTCTFGTLAAGATQSIRIVVRPNAAGTITNTVTVTGNQSDPNTANNTASATTTVTAAAAAQGSGMLGLLGALPVGVGLVVWKRRAIAGAVRSLRLRMRK